MLHREQGHQRAKKKMTPQIRQASDSPSCGAPWRHSQHPLDTKLWKSLEFITLFLVAWGAYLSLLPRRTFRSNPCIGDLSQKREMKWKTACSIVFAKKKKNVQWGRVRSKGNPTPLLSPPLWVTFQDWPGSQIPGGCLSPSPSGVQDPGNSSLLNLPHGCLPGRAPPQFP